MSAQASKVEKFPVSYRSPTTEPENYPERRPHMAADGLTVPAAQIAVAAWLVALTDEVVALGGNRAALAGAARNIMETLGVDPDHGGAAAVLEQLSG